MSGNDVAGSPSVTASAEQGGATSKKNTTASLDGRKGHEIAQAKRRAADAVVAEAVAAAPAVVAEAVAAADADEDVAGNAAAVPAEAAARAPAPPAPRSPRLVYTRWLFAVACLVGALSVAIVYTSPAMLFHTLARSSDVGSVGPTSSSSSASSAAGTPPGGGPSPPPSTPPGQIDDNKGAEDERARVGNKNGRTITAVENEECSVDTRTPPRVKEEYPDSSWRSFDCIPFDEFDNMYSSPPKEFDEWLYSKCFAVYGVDRFYPWSGSERNAIGKDANWCPHMMTYHVRAIEVVQQWRSRPDTCGGHPACQEMSDNTKALMRDMSVTWETHPVVVC